VIPFGAAPDVQADVAGVSNSDDDDAFSPALPVTRGPGTSALTATQLSELQVLMAAEAIGAAQETFDRAIEYSQERVAYGSPISGFQAMRHWMADMHVNLELAKSTLFWALNVEPAERARALKLGVDLAQKVATDAIQVFGGIGFTWDFGAHFYMRHTMAANEIVHMQAHAA
jgi:alkylation response protein AidB-like acyl-CoA dehydrogenase